MTKEITIRPVVGHHIGWGQVGRKFKVRPYTLTEGSTDVMSVRVREKIDIYGIGIDVIEMEGVFVVRRDHPRVPKGCQKKTLEWGNAEIKAEFRMLELVGESELFGTVRARLNPAHVTRAEVVVASKTSRAGACVANMYPEIELPELGMVLSTGDQSVKLESKVAQVPPVGDVARSVNTAPLVDESGKAVGEIVSADIEVGSVIMAIPLGETGKLPAIG